MYSFVKQLAFTTIPKARTEHGGAIRQGKRKLARPLDPKRPLHLVLRSEKARGRLSLLYGQNWRAIERLTAKLSRRYGVRVYQFANSGNHLHLLVRGKTRKGLQDFLRVFSGKIAQFVTGAKKGHAFGKFWSALAYSRVVEWGRAFTEAKYYVLRNELEADGFLDYRPQKPKPAVPT
ncbi:MAG: transposase [Oligoflexia bacterium]|nr:transposase [Oligoflexia bacterium]